MNRILLIQEIFKKSNFKNYLEIGCRWGDSFLPVKAKRKIAVDPDFNISFKKKLKWLFKVPNNIYNRYFEEESDTFFNKRQQYLNRLGHLDVVLVDGLHTFRGSLHDVLNTLKFLNINGIIVMHDCLPPHKAAALPLKHFPKKDEQANIEGWTGEWCGDVWKTIVYLTRKHQGQLDICVIDADYGLGIVRPTQKLNDENMIIDEKLFGEIDNLSYEDMIADPVGILNLKKPDYAYSIINDVTNEGNA